MSSVFFQFWQNLPYLIDPVAFSVGPFALRWYSFSYLAAFLTTYLLLRWRIKKKETQLFNYQVLDLFALYAIIGLLAGARIGYVLFYNFPFFLESPLLIIWPFHEGAFIGLSGMSFHGGLMGMIIGSVIFTKRNRLRILDLADFVVPAVPLGYFWGRIGNFMNGELFGRTTENPWGMHFPSSQTTSLRHPSQLYEAILEGLFIFAILWPLRNHPKLKHKFLGFYLVLYGIIRFFIEFVRQPDAGIALTLAMTRGQVLSLIMIIVGAVLIHNSSNSSKA